MSAASITPLDMNLKIRVLPRPEAEEESFGCGRPEVRRIRSR
jgi:hypothetical protein